MTAGEDTPAAPVLRVVNSDATPEEIAAIVAVFASLGGGDTAPPPEPAREWNAPRRLAGAPVAHGRSGWRASGLPH